MGKFEVKGLDKLQKDLKQMQRQSEKLSRGVGFLEVFTDRFMSANTKFSSAETFFAAFGQPWKTDAEFEAIPENELDAFVAANSKFSSWEQMLGAASAKFIGF